jgi:hypothetical protein
MADFWLPPIIPHGSLWDGDSGLLDREGGYV